MIKIGEYNELEIVKQVDFGVYLGIDDIEILLPTKWVPRDAKIGDTISVFIIRDSDDRLLATTVKPLATANTFAFLEVKQVNNIGAFLDWGMDKDLLVPFREQSSPMEEGKSYVVFVYEDEQSNRLIASSKLSRFIVREDIDLETGDVVELLVYSKTKLGYNAIINNLYSGLIYENEIFESIRIGDHLKGYVKTIREDNKIDLSLQKSGFELMDDAKWKILSLLKNENGFLALHDNSSPEEVKAKLQMSKKAFKKAIGSLYREKLVTLTDKGVQLV
ncbi:MAG TPA: S1-like domain-containing RNA-binding protein [Bacteroidia bacterium]|nr:S1-like domain-containing RNA-binding protein [Bacteroidia bacterium]HRG51943.1 S1-like domain-containing RNA-binding protein [Bacteroidia bacterium]